MQKKKKKKKNNQLVEPVEVQSQLWEFSNNWQTSHSYSFPKNGQKTGLNWTLKHYSL